MSLSSYRSSHGSDRRLSVMSEARKSSAADRLGMGERFQGWLEKKGGGVNNPLSRTNWTRRWFVLQVHVATEYFVG